MEGRVFIGSILSKMGIARNAKQTRTEWPIPVRNCTERSYRRLDQSVISVKENTFNLTVAVNRD